MPNLQVNYRKTTGFFNVDVRQVLPATVENAKCRKEACGVAPPTLHCLHSGHWPTHRPFPWYQRQKNLVNCRNVMRHLARVGITEANGPAIRTAKFGASETGDTSVTARLLLDQHKTVADKMRIAETVEAEEAQRGCVGDGARATKWSSSQFKQKKQQHRRRSAVHVRWRWLVPGRTCRHTMLSALQQKAWQLLLRTRQTGRIARPKSRSLLLVEMESTFMVCHAKMFGSATATRRPRPSPPRSSSHRCVTHGMCSISSAHAF